MAALVFVHSDRRLLESVHRLLERRRVEHRVLEDERGLAVCLHQVDVGAVAAGVRIRGGGGLALLENLMSSRPSVGRFLVGPRLPSDADRHLESGLLHAHFSLPFDMGELLGFAGLGQEARGPSIEDHLFAAPLIPIRGCGPTLISAAKAEPGLDVHRRFCRRA